VLGARWLASAALGFYRRVYGQQLTSMDDPNAAYKSAGMISATMSRTREPHVPLTQTNGMRSMEIDQRLRAPRLKGLDGSRFIAASCIICYHFYDPVLGSFAHGGSSWISYFFFLSGFVLAYRDFTTPKAVQRLSALKYLKHRLIKVYPIYIFALLTVLFEATRLDHTPFEWGCLPLHFAMAQAWFPICSDWNTKVDDYQCCSTSWNSIGWFMSTIIPFWLLGRPLVLVFRRATVFACLVGMTSLWLWTIVPSVIAHFNVDKLPGVRTWDFIMSGPFGYWHIFSFGVPAARMFIKLGMYDIQTDGEVTLDTKEFGIQESDRVHWLFNWGATIGYTCIFLFMGLGRQSFDFHWAFYHSGGFLPVFLLIAMGLGSGHDPIAKYALATGPFVLLGAISYAMSLLQFRIWWLLVCLRGKEPSRALYPFVLVFVACISYVTIEVPYAQWQRWRAEKGKFGTDDKVIDFVERKVVMLYEAVVKYLRSMDVWRDREFFGTIPHESEVGDPDEADRGSRNWLLGVFTGQPQTSTLCLSPRTDQSRTTESHRCAVLSSSPSNLPRRHEDEAAE